MNKLQRPPGQVKQITSLTNPVIKSIKGLALKKKRDLDNLFLAEGLKHTLDALECGWHIRTFIHSNSETNQTIIAKTAAHARASGADVLEVSDKILASITKRDNPQMVVSVIEQNWTAPENLLGSIKNPGDVFVILDRIRDPGNLGTILRTADGVGAKGCLLLGDCTDPFGIEAVRASMGSLFHIPVARCSLDKFLTIRSLFHGKLFGTHLEGAIDYRHPNYDQNPIGLVMGNESSGMPAELAAACEALIRIPMSGGADSLNLAVATGISLYEMRRNFLENAAQQNTTRPLSYKSDLPLE